MSLPAPPKTRNPNPKAEPSTVSFPAPELMESDEMDVTAIDCSPGFDESMSVNETRFPPMGRLCFSNPLPSGLRTRTSSFSSPENDTDVPESDTENANNRRSSRGSKPRSLLRTFRVRFGLAGCARRLRILAGIFMDYRLRILFERGGFDRNFAGLMGVNTNPTP